MDAPDFGQPQARQRKRADREVERGEGEMDQTTHGTPVVLESVFPQPRSTGRGPFLMVMRFTGFLRAHALNISYVYFPKREQM